MRGDCSRYCDMCGVSAKVEEGLNADGHQFLPALAQGREDAFSPVCGQIASDSYEFKVRSHGGVHLSR